MLNDAAQDYWLGGSTASALEVKSASRLPRPRRSLGDKVRAALGKLAAGRGVVISHQEKAWASITFSGSRHEVVLQFTGTDAVIAGEDLVERLPDHEFAIPGHLVADAAIGAVEHLFGPEERLTITCVLLLLEEH
ncbi:MAG: hypothetical protein ACK4IS_02295 [Erythrobacter sp.]